MSEADSSTYGESDSRRRELATGNHATGDYRLNLWVRWEQVNFSLYELRRITAEYPDIHSILLHDRLWQELREIESELGVSSAPTPPFAQSSAWIW